MCSSFTILLSSRNPNVKVQYLLVLTKKSLAPNYRSYPRVLISSMLSSCESMGFAKKFLLVNSKPIWPEIPHNWFECTWKVYHHLNPLIEITCPLEVK